MYPLFVSNFVEFLQFLCWSFISWRYSSWKIIVFAIVSHCQWQCFLQQQLVLLLLATIKHYNSNRDRWNLSRQAIVLPQSLPWQHLFDNTDPDSFLLMTGVTRDVFGMLLTILCPASTIQRLIWAKGRPRLISTSEVQCR